MTRLACPVAVLTVGGREPGGATVSWVTQVSHRPPLLAVALSHRRHVLKLLEENGCFALNVLSEHQREVAEHFAREHVAGEDRFFALSHGEGETGAPLLADVVAYYECRVVGTHDAGDHRLVIGEVVSSGTGDENRPLVSTDTGLHYAIG